MRTFSNAEAAVLTERCRGEAVAGAILIGVTLPTILVCWNSGWEGPDFVPAHLHKVAWKAEMLKSGHNLPPDDFRLGKLVGSWLWLQIVATFGCGPGAAILGTVLFERARVYSQKRAHTLQSISLFGIIVGGAIAFLNLPGYFAPLVMPRSEFVFEKMLLLFTIAGASSGAWISWQAWRAANMEKNFWPRFSLGTLLLFVIAWGALMMVFAPA